ncbi:MAG TPA: hypothetical protein PLZ52_01510 [Bacteroidales bacterium]|nr:hypothetical protein [Bacteroidales bacterium]
MRSLLGIYRLNPDFDLKNTQVVENCFVKDRNQDKLHSHGAGDFKIIQYEYFNDIQHIYKTPDSLLGFNGTIYPRCMPSDLPECSPDKLLNHVAETLIPEDIETVKRFGGKYNLFYYNVKTNTLNLVNDRFGLQPMFYYCDNDVFMFCSDYEALAEYKDCKNNISREALMEYLIFGAPQNNKTFLKDIRLLPPGSKVSCYKGLISFEHFYPNLDINNSADDLHEISYNYYNCFRREVNLMLNWYPNVDITLTGGTDTRMILGAMDEGLRGQHQFMTFRYKLIPDEENQDIIIARLLAKEFGLKHQVVERNFYSPQLMGENYFKGLRNTTTFFVSGYLGSETLRFSPSYPNNISEITRKFITNKSNSYLYNTTQDFIFHIENSYAANKTLRIANHGLNKLFNKSVFLNFNAYEEEIYRSISHVKNDFKELSYTGNYLIRSFFSRHCGGAKSNMLLPSVVNQYLFSPYALPDILQIAWGINPKFLFSNNKGISNYILKEFLPDFCGIPSNSHITQHEGTVLKPLNQGRLAVDCFKFDYPASSQFVTNDMFNSVFKTETIMSEYIIKNRQNHVWFDLKLWFDYMFR